MIKEVLVCFIKRTPQEVPAIHTQPYYFKSLWVFMAVFPSSFPSSFFSIDSKHCMGLFSAVSEPSSL